MFPPRLSTAPAARILNLRFAAVGLALVLLATSVMAGCGTSTKSNAAGVDSITTTAPIDPGPGPTTFTAAVRLDPVASGLDSPIALVARPMRNQLWVAERGGHIKVIARTTTWDLTRSQATRSGYQLQPSAVLDLSDLTSTEGERGLLGLAFSSDGQTLYVDHTAKNGDIVIASYAITDVLDDSGAPTIPEDNVDPSPSSTTSTAPLSVSRPRVDPSSRKVLLTISHRTANNHNGGQLALGPDGYLYIGTGDGGRPVDASNAQDPRSLLGKILRIDPAVTDGSTPYSIPETNPFAQSGGAPEVWALGLRNPWRFSFDRRTGDLWIGDVGQSEREEIDELVHDAAPGANFGWPLREGNIDGGSSATTAAGTATDLVEPVTAYPHTDGNCAITGGFVYRGTAITALQGVYVYGDHCTSQLRGLLSRRGVRLDDHTLRASVDPQSLVSFGQDDQGEVYVVSSSGTIAVLVGTK